MILARNEIDYSPFRRFLWKGETLVHARDGRFELTGLDPEKPAPAYFLDAEHEWSAAVELSARPAGEEPTIRLQPCGRARARFVGPDGRPIAGLRTTYYFDLLMTPGAADPREAPEGDQLGADQAYLPWVDPRHYPYPPRRTDADGRIELPDLIPGALYRISDRTTVNDPKRMQIRKDFTVKPGETVDLGDILVEYLKEGRNELKRLVVELRRRARRASE